MLSLTVKLRGGGGWVLCVFYNLKLDRVSPNLVENIGVSFSIEN